MVEKQKEKPLLTIEGVEYFEKDLTEEQKIMISHIGDLERKINSSTFNLQQLQFGSKAFSDALKISLKSSSDEKNQEKEKKDAD